MFYRTPAHRLLLTQFGLLNPENRSKTILLPLNDELLDELEGVDNVYERDCLTVSLYFARSGRVAYDDLVEAVGGVSDEFEHFAESLGWPVDLSKHTGFRGKLTPDICEKSPYYADENFEVMFHVPYFIRRPHEDSVSSAAMIKRVRQVTESDKVCIVWIESMRDLVTMPRKIGGNASVIIFVHPLEQTPGLYLIRIGKHSSRKSIAASKIPEDRLVRFYFH